MKILNKERGVGEQAGRRGSLHVYICDDIVAMQEHWKA